MLEIIPNIAEISMGIDNILKIKFLSKSNITEDIAEKVIQVASKISGTKKHCNLVDTRDMMYMDDKARKLFAKQDKSTVKAVGVIINSKFQKSLANLYLKFSNPVIPTKMFDNEADAVSWLKSV